MVKLTKVCTAIALSLMISLLLFTSGAFAQSANQSSARMAGQRMTPALAGWQHGCGRAFCDEESGAMRCRSMMKSIRVWRTRWISETIKTLRLHQSVLFVHEYGRTLRVIHMVKSWQIRHVTKKVRTLQVLKRSFRECSAW